MGTWIAVAIGLFVLGSMMALKPNGVELRLDKLRMSARRLELHPRLISCPEWIRGRNNEFGSGMMGQYALVLDDMKFPETRYQVLDGQLRPDSSVKPASEHSLTEPSGPVVNYDLDGESLDLPDTIAPFVKAVYSKANSLVVFWDDSGYVKPNTNPHYDANQIEPDLLALKSRMLDWAQKLSQ